VLATLEHIRNETDCWLEVTTLLVPGYNDSDEELERIDRRGWRSIWGKGRRCISARSIRRGRCGTRRPTPAETLRRARTLAKENGLRHVYVGNVRGEEDATATFCPDCGARLIEREGFRAVRTGMDSAGRCRTCGKICEGVWQ
jgi:pyruvate formate lyase activating enzyme